MTTFKMRMFASISHELRTPLNCQVTFIEAIEPMLDEDIKENFILPIKTN